MQGICSYPTTFDLQNRMLSVLATDTALEIDSYITQSAHVIIRKDAPASKLSRIIFNEATELEKLPQENIIEYRYREIHVLADSLYLYEGKNSDSHYKIKSIKEITKLPELKNTIIPVMYRIAANLKSFKELPKEQKEVLRDWSLVLSDTLNAHCKFSGTSYLLAS